MSASRPQVVLRYQRGSAESQAPLMGGEEENCEKKDTLMKQKHEAKNARVVQLLLQMLVQRQF